MKYIFNIFLLLTLISCSQLRKATNTQSIIEIDSVGCIYIKKKLYGTDSVLLNQNETKLFVQKWNNAKPMGLYKMGAEFWLTVLLNNDSTRSFKIYGDLIMEKGDRAFALGDSSLIRSFWESKTLEIFTPQPSTSSE